MVPAAPADLARRRDRLVQSIRRNHEMGAFGRIVLADATLGDDDRADLFGTLPFLEIPVLHTSPHGEHSGPSYLEALLYGELLRTRTVARDGEPWVKVTGGYTVTNLEAVLDAFERHGGSGLGFLHQHPLRLQPRYAMSAFYLLDGTHMNRFFEFVSEGAERARREPLEGFLLEFLRGQGAATVRAPYPQIDAWFATAGLSSDSPKLRANWAAWRILSALGVYALRLPPVAP
ncbi:MAG: hypothetical protein QOJ12_3031 [Thermoleophilales bacterium]|nr:hypothetical protein [Thermoleophilales bacterium]